MGTPMSEDDELREMVIDRMNRSREYCPGCGSASLTYSCHFSYGSWRCWGCGAHIDGRVASPLYLTTEEHAEQFPSDGAA